MQNSPKLRDRRSTVTAGARLTAAATALLLGLTACSTPNDAPAQGPSGTNDDAAAASERVAVAMAPVDDVELNLPAITGVPDLAGQTVLIVPAAGLPFSVAVTALENTLSEAGLQSRTCDGKGVPSTMSDCLQSAAGLDIAAVVTLGIPYQLIPNAYDDLTAQGVPVLAAFQDADGKEETDALAFQPATVSLGRALEISFDYVVSKTDGTGEFLFLGLADSEFINKVATDGADYLRANCAECVITQEDHITATTDQVPSIVSAHMVKHPDVDYVVAMNIDVDGSGVVAGLQDAARPEVPFGGPGAGFAGLQLAQQGEGRFVTLISWNYLSWTWTDALLRLMTGAAQEEYPVVARLFDSAGAAELNLDEAAAVTFEYFGDKPSFPAAFKQAWSLAG